MGSNFTQHSSINVDTRMAMPINNSFEFAGIKKKNAHLKPMRSSTHNRVTGTDISERCVAHKNSRVYILTRCTTYNGITSECGGQWRAVAGDQPVANTLGCSGRALSNIAGSGSQTLNFSFAQLPSLTLINQPQPVCLVWLSRTKGSPCRATERFKPSCD